MIPCQWWFLFLGVLVFFSGCSGTNPDDPRVQIWGSRGGDPGRYAGPRGITARQGFVYVVDRTGRVQKLDAQGNFILQWTIDPHDNGTPTNLSIDQAGDVWVPDTHNSRILHFSPQGELIASFGEYGEEAGKFIYPTGIAFGETGELFVTEYGVRDRVQVFTRDGIFSGRSWGDHGDGEHDFNRPMDIEKGPDGLLYIADSINNRIKVYTEDGKWIRHFGEEGDQPGQLNIPYDMDFDAAGNLFVVEFGNHRVQKFSPEGDALGLWGGPGSGKGQLAQPWGLAEEQGFLYVTDTKNHRLQIFPNELVVLSGVHE